MQVTLHILLMQVLYLACRVSKIALQSKLDATVKCLPNFRVLTNQITNIKIVFRYSVQKSPAFKLGFFDNINMQIGLFLRLHNH